MRAFSVRVCVNTCKWDECVDVMFFLPQQIAHRARCYVHRDPCPRYAEGTQQNYTPYLGGTTARDDQPSRLDPDAHQQKRGSGGAESWENKTKTDGVCDGSCRLCRAHTYTHDEKAEGEPMPYEVGFKTMKKYGAANCRLHLPVAHADVSPKRITAEKRTEFIQEKSGFEGCRATCRRKTTAFGERQKNG